MEKEVLVERDVLVGKEELLAEKVDSVEKGRRRQETVKVDTKVHAGAARRSGTKLPSPLGMASNCRLLEASQQICG